MGTRLISAFLVAGLVFLFLGSVFEIGVHALLHIVIQQQLPITSNTSRLYSEWVNPSLDVYMQYYFWNVKNPWAIAHEAALPDVELIGPFTYIEKRIKNNVTWENDYDIISYDYTDLFYPIDVYCNSTQNLTTDPCTFPYETMITSINLPIIGISYQLMMKNSSFLVELFNNILNYPNISAAETLFVNHTVNEWIWGYNDTLLVDIHKKLAHLGIVLDFIPPPLVQLNQNMTLIDKVTSKVYSGKNNIEKVLAFESFTGNEEYMFVNGSTTKYLWSGCSQQQNGNNYQQFNRLGSMINGSEGYQVPPFVSKDETLYIFSTELSRSAFLQFNNSIKLDGVELMRFTLQPIAFANVEDNEFNCAFSANGPSGVFNMTSLIDAPVFASQPLFYQADSYYTDHVNGTGQPDPLIHQTYLDVEPWTGACFRAHQRLQVCADHYFLQNTANNFILQLNVQVQPCNGLNITKNIASGLEYGFYLPIMYGDENAMITPSLTSQFKGTIGLALSMGSYGGWILTVIGGVCLLMYFALGLRVIIKQRERTSFKIPERSPLLQSQLAIN